VKRVETDWLFLIPPQGRPNITGHRFESGREECFHFSKNFNATLGQINISISVCLSILSLIVQNSVAAAFWKFFFSFFKIKRKNAEREIDIQIERERERETDRERERERA